MTAALPPKETDLLCESCGYTLNGLPEDSRCPECGQPISASLGQKRHPPAWEQARGLSKIPAFFRTSTTVIFHPTYFYQTLNTRPPRRALRIDAAGTFALIHWLLASMLFGVAGAVHGMLFALNGPSMLSYRGRDWGFWLFWALAAVGLAIAAYVLLHVSTWAAARLTAWEAAYRGYRLPISVVRRGLAYHSAHYLPVAMLTFLTVLAYHLGVQTHRFDLTTLTTCLYVLCAEVILFAAYLFQTYWIAMRNMMYANR